MPLDLIGKALILKTNVPEKCQIKWTITLDCLEIASQFRQKDWTRNLFFREKSSDVSLLLHECHYNSRWKYKKSELHGKIMANNLRNMKTEDWHE